MRILMRSHEPENVDAAPPVFPKPFVYTIEVFVAASRLDVVVSYISVQTTAAFAGVTETNRGASRATRLSATLLLIIA